MQVEVEPSYLYFQEAPPLPLQVHTLCFWLLVVEVVGQLLMLETMHCFPHLVAIVAMVELWRRGVAEEVLMVGQEAQTGLLDTQTRVMTMVVQQGVVDTWAMEVAYMMVGQAPAPMVQEEDFRLLEALLEWEDPVQLLALMVMVDLVVVAQETMLEEEGVDTVEVILVHLPIDVEGVEGAHMISMEPHLLPLSTACGTPLCMGLLLPTTPVDTA